MGVRSESRDSRLQVRWQQYGGDVGDRKAQAGGEVVGIQEQRVREGLGKMKGL